MFISSFREVWNYEGRVSFPTFSSTRVMMMPVRLGDDAGVPAHYLDLYRCLCDSVEKRYHGDIGYLTIDEQELQPGQTLRRAGKHVDGYYHGRAGAWSDGGGGGWGSVGNGMLTVSSTSHCRAYLGMIDGLPRDEGECDHLTMPNDGYLFEANRVYWVDGACVHESLPVSEPTKRQFVRLSMPSNGPWFEGYSKNPTGILPRAEILPPRTEFMQT
jgi:hypothetical protein